MTASASGRPGVEPSPRRSTCCSRARPRSTAIGLIAVVLTGTGSDGVGRRVEREAGRAARSSSRARRPRCSRRCRPRCSPSLVDARADLGAIGGVVTGLLEAADRLPGRRPGRCPPDGCSTGSATGAGSISARTSRPRSSAGSRDGCGRPGTPTSPSTPRSSSATRPSTTAWSSSMLIKVTGFLRDGRMWDHLRGEVDPRAARHRPARAPRAARLVGRLLHRARRPIRWR